MNLKRQTCAACKLQRKRCAPDCLMAPHFPANKSKQFLNAHKLFGVGKLTKMVGNLPPHLRGAAMATAAVEAEHRAKDPVGGCHAVVVSLMGLIKQYEAELHSVRSQLHMLRDGGDGGVLPGFLGDCKYDGGFENGFDPELHLQKNIGQGSQDHSNVDEQNVFDLRDEVVLEQDVNPIQDEEDEECDIKGVSYHSNYQFQMVKDEYDDEQENAIVQEESGIVEQLVPQPHQEESNGFGLRDEAVLEQDVKPMQYLSVTSGKG